MTHPTAVQLPHVSADGEMVGSIVFVVLVVAVITVSIIAARRSGGRRRR